jgi:hypothetical protein
MKTRIFVACWALMALSLVSCQPAAAPAAAMPPASTPAPSPTVKIAVEIAAPEESPTPPPAALRQPTYLPAGYELKETILDDAARSVCLWYQHKDEAESLLLIAQGPRELAPSLEKVAGWPDYAFIQEDVAIGGAQNAQRLLGYRREDWACAGKAAATPARYSFALAPRLSWEQDGQVFEIYSASAGCAATGGVTGLDLLRVAEGLTGTTTHAADELDPECLRSVADASRAAGFEVQSPASLPADTAFYYAALDESGVVLHFYNLKHAAMGSFFRISQSPAASPAFLADCGDLASPACEELQAGSTPVVYQYFNPTEQLDWSAGGMYFSLFRNAGEPGKIYKDDLLKVVASMQ